MIKSCAVTKEVVPENVCRTHETRRTCPVGYRQGQNLHDDRASCCRPLLPPGVGLSRPTLHVFVAMAQHFFFGWVGGLVSGWGVPYLPLSLPKIAVSASWRLKAEMIIRVSTDGRKVFMDILPSSFHAVTDCSFFFLGGGVSSFTSRFFPHLHLLA